MSIFMPFVKIRGSVAFGMRFEYKGAILPACNIYMNLK